MQKTKKNNVLIIMADELRDDIVRHQYRHQVPLPNLDRLREQGITLENCFCQTPTCCPSRGSFSTGKYPHQLQLWNHGDMLPPEERTMGHQFSEHGYETAAIGKTHNMCPGFRSITYDRKTAFASNHGYNVTDEDCVGVFEGPEEEFGDFIACRQFDEFLSNRSEEQPFLVHLGIYSPHPPLYPPKRFLDMFDWRDIQLPEPENPDTKPKKQLVPRSRWDNLSETGQKKVIAAVLAMSALVDECVGQVLQSLSKRQLLDDTLIVFTSDHGDMMGAHGILGKFYNHYEEALKVPMIMRLPGAEQAGTQRAELTEMLDVYPTLCDITGVPRPEEPHKLAGRSLLPLIEGTEKNPRNYVFSQIEHAYMVRTEDWKLVYHTEDRSELYNLANDPGEKNNLFGRPKYREIERDLLLKITHTLGTHRREGYNRGRNKFFG